MLRQTAFSATNTNTIDPEYKPLGPAVGMDSVSSKPFPGLFVFDGSRNPPLVHHLHVQQAPRRTLARPVGSLIRALNYHAS
uniref:Uncharacterized protein n=1 Tax=Moniliophthora roreri TaxID=221103 RepID=A0A0W0FJB1_MONRR